MLSGNREEKAAGFAAGFFIFQNINFLNHSFQDRHFGNEPNGKPRKEKDGKGERKDVRGPVTSDAHMGEVKQFFHEQNMDQVDAEGQLADFGQPAFAQGETGQEHIDGQRSHDDQRTQIIKSVFRIAPMHECPPTGKNQTQTGGKINGKSQGGRNFIVHLGKGMTKDEVTQVRNEPQNEQGWITEADIPKIDHYPGPKKPQAQQVHFLEAVMIIQNIDEGRHEIQADEHKKEPHVIVRPAGEKAPTDLTCRGVPGVGIFGVEQAPKNNRHQELVGPFFEKNFHFFGLLFEEEIAAAHHKKRHADAREGVQNVAGPEAAVELAPIVAHEVGADVQENDQEDGQGPDEILGVVSLHN